MNIDQIKQLAAKNKKAAEISTKENNAKTFAAQESYVLKFAKFSSQEFDDNEYKKFVEQYYKILKKIERLPSSLEIIELRGKERGGDEYSGGWFSASIYDYTGKKPAIVNVSSYQYWRGNSSRGQESYYFVIKGKEPELIVTQIEGDGFNIVNYKNYFFDFKEVYKATH